MNAKPYTPGQIEVRLQDGRWFHCTAVVAARYITYGPIYEVQLKLFKIGSDWQTATLDTIGNEPRTQYRIRLVNPSPQPKAVGWFKYDKVSGCHHPQYDHLAERYAVEQGWVQLYRQEMPALKGWKFERVDRGPFKDIVVTAPNGYTAVLDQMARNPENVFYMLADEILKEQEKWHKTGTSVSSPSSSTSAPSATWTKAPTHSDGAL